MISEGDEGAPSGGAPGRTYRNSARLRVVVGPLLAPAVCRVVSGVAAHVDCPTDRLDDALVICDVIAAHAPAYVGDRYVLLTVNAGEGALQLRIEALEPDGAQKLIADAQVPGVGNVLEQMASGLQVQRGEDGAEELLINVDFVPAASPAPTSATPG